MLGEKRRELRAVPKLECREVVAVGDKPAQLIVRGIPIVYNQETIIYDPWFGEYREVIASGAGAKTITPQNNIRMLNQHDTKQPLGTTKYNTLSLIELPAHVEMECILPPTEAGRSFYEQVKRGDIDGMSFGFYVLEERWTYSDSKDVLPLREILEYELIEVSGVTFPAYQQTSIAIRSAFSEAGYKDFQTLGALVNRSRHCGLNDDQRATARVLLKSFEQILREEPEAKPADADALKREQEAKAQEQYLQMDIELKLLELDAIA